MAERFSADRDVIRVDFFAVVADHSLRYGAGYSRLVQQCRKKRARAKMPTAHRCSSSNASANPLAALQLN
jgi:hypothetical protein